MNKETDERTAKLVQASPMLAAIGEEMSFTSAATRLNIDQSAVSHRVKSLEASLGRTLFDRTTRCLQLTEAGEILCRAAIDTMTAWTAALDRLDRGRSGNLIQLSLPSSLAMKWLIPILPRANAAGLDIAVEVNENKIGFQGNDADAAIRFGPGPYPGLHSTHLAHCRLQPVASRSYLKDLDGGALLRKRSNAVLLADRGGENDETDFNWQHYFPATGLSEEAIEADQHFDRADLMLQAAIGGMGIGLGRTLLIEADLEAGFLRKVGASAGMRSGYWLVCAPAFAETRRFARLRDWLRTEIRLTTEDIDLSA